jgi:hypothetical protein
MSEPGPATSGWNRPPGLRLASFAATSLGGLLVGLGSLMHWGAVSVRIPGATGNALTSEVPGVDLLDGKVTLVIGFALLVLGVAMRGISSRSAARFLGWVIVAAAIVATGIAILDVVRKDSAFDRGAQDTAHTIANTTGLPYTDILARMERYLTVDLRLGIYLTAAGAVVALVGGLLGIAWVSARDDTARADVAGAPLPPDRSAPLPPERSAPLPPPEPEGPRPSASQIPPD